LGFRNIRRLVLAVVSLACDKNNGFVTSEAFFEKHLPLIREAARNDYSFHHDGWPFRSVWRHILGEEARNRPQKPLSRDGPGMDGRDKYQYMEGYL